MTCPICKKQIITWQYRWFSSSMNQTGYRSVCGNHALLGRGETVEESEDDFLEQLYQKFSHVPDL